MKGGRARCSGTQGRASYWSGMAARIAGASRSPWPTSPIDRTGPSTPRPIRPAGATCRSGLSVAPAERSGHEERGARHRHPPVRPKTTQLCLANL
eukprot:351903-Chlamydomonas_euryale.AAC.2